MIKKVSPFAAIVGTGETKTIRNDPR